MKDSIIISFIYIILVPCFLQAQNELGSSDDASRIVLNTFVPEQVEGLTAPAKSNLENKLSQIATKAGMGGSATDPRFIITANVVVVTKDITPTAPPMHSYTIEVTLYIGDGLEGTKFATTSVSLKGVGETETKAYMMALKNLKVTDPSYQSFVEEGKKKIVEYYNAKCDFILKEADMLSGQNKFDEAIAKLVSIPEVCKSCYDKAMSAVQPIFQKKIDRECKLLMAEANNAWNTNQNSESAILSSNFLARIEPTSVCYSEALALSDKIGKRVLELDKREWNFKLKQQQDNIDIRKATIKAARDIGVAYGQNQPRNITYNVRGWW